jgi:hypothetical protein
MFTSLNSFEPGANVQSLSNQQMYLLLEHQRISQDKGKEALFISENILNLNNQIIAENYNLANVEKDIAANSTIIEYICIDLKRTSDEIKVRDLNFYACRRKLR